MTDATIWTGELRKGQQPDTVEGELIDAWGWRVSIRGVRQPGGKYALTGTIDGQVPIGLQQPAETE
jgi:hypothetical protein